MWSATRRGFEKCIHTKMNEPSSPVHEQSIELCVLAVTRARMSVYGQERREGFIKATILHRNIMHSNESNKTWQDYYNKTCQCYILVLYAISVVKSFLYFPLTSERC